MKEGSGPAIYGIKVCEALGLSSEFVGLAKEIQMELDGMNNLKESVYNKKVILDKCEICGEKAEETHHIKEQCDANSDNMIDHHHKNNQHNLVPLCKLCHQKTTHGSLIIEEYVQTGEGKKLIYHFGEKKKSRKKYDDEMVKKILTYKKEYDMNISNCIKILKLNNIKIGRETLKKIMKNKY